MPREHTSAGTDWLEPAPDHRGLERALQAIRERIWFAIAVFALCVGAAVIYVSAADPVYEAEANILVIPIPGEDAILRSLGLISETSDPSLDVETAAQLIDTPEIATRAAELLGTDQTQEQILEAVLVQPVPESNIVAVTASAGTPDEASDLANAFANATVEERTAELDRRITGVLPRLEAQIQTLPDGDARTELAAEVARLRTLQTGEDPTVRFEIPATAPETPVSPRKVLTVVLATIAGLVLGIGGALAFRAFDPRLRREEQLRQLYRIPILARIPREPWVGPNPLGPQRLSPPVREAYRTLRATLASTGGAQEPRQSILVTSSSASEGKTTTAVNLAVSLSLSGHSVILIDADLRRPAVGKALRVKSNGGLIDVLTNDHRLENALVPVSAYGEGLRVLLADEAESGMIELFSTPAAAQLVDESQKLADYVIVDSAPLSEVIDALPIAQRVDKVLIVARLGKSRLSRIKELGELLAGSGIRPAGFALLGVSRGGRGYYYAAPREADRTPVPVRRAEDTAVES